MERDYGIINAFGAVLHWSGWGVSDDAPDNDLGEVLHGSGFSFSASLCISKRKNDKPSLIRLASFGVILA
uniref:Uncharacterized protein n=1 Tax=Los Azufres archaeal virus 2 TaxID=1425359 RepID=A0A0A0P5X5_9VIRU|nr:hypothetical protein [Los Azufres archaeal virus 2]